MRVADRGPTPFDEAAETYDEVALSRLGQELRSRVHQTVTPLLEGGVRLLDVGCGTGLDASWAGGLGANVVGFDASDKMIEQARQRLVGAARVSVQDVESDTWVEGSEGNFDVVLANFGVVNCLDDLAGFGKRLDSVLAEGGRVVLVPMARVVPWEMVAALARLDIGKARRRFGRQRVESDDGSNSVVTYYTGRSMVRALGPQWRVESVEALGWALPTYAQRSIVERRPRILRALAALDRFGAGVVGSMGGGDHQIVVIERQSGD